MSEAQMVALEPLGDRAFLAHFENEKQAARWAATVRLLALPAVTDVVLAYCSAAVFADPDQANLEELESRLSSLAAEEGETIAGKLLEIPVLYDGPDLPAVSRRLSMTPAGVIALHASVVYDVFAIGFLQGFPYAGYLPPALSGLERRDEPRLEVPSGAVGIAGRQTGIYPQVSPGGWHLLGRTPLQIADADTGYFPIRAGDRLRFRPIDLGEFEARCHERV
jgi:KipI family sensor histidine kinase inhibitor